MYFLIAYMVYASIAFCTRKNDMRPELFLCLSMGQVYFERKETSKLMFYVFILQTLATIGYFILTIV